MWGSLAVAMHNANRPFECIVTIVQGRWLALPGLVDMVRRTSDEALKETWWNICGLSFGTVFLVLFQDSSCRFNIADLT